MAGLDGFLAVPGEAALHFGRGVAKVVEVLPAGLTLIGETWLSRGVG